MTFLSSKLVQEKHECTIDSSQQSKDGTEDRCELQIKDAARSQKGFVH